MGVSFSATVSALTYSIIQERCPGASDRLAFPQNEVVRFVLDQHERMPDYLRLPLVLLTVAFDAWALPRTGTVFHRLPHARRWQQILAWKHSVFGIRRDLIRFYETLAVFGWFAEIYGAAGV